MNPYYYISDIGQREKLPEDGSKNRPDKKYPKLQTKEERALEKFHRNSVRECAKW